MKGLDTWSTFCDLFGSGLDWKGNLRVAGALRELDPWLTSFNFNNFILHFFWIWVIDTNSELRAKVIQFPRGPRQSYSRFATLYTGPTSTFQLSQQTSHYFPELPQEFRDTIWEFTTSLQPRIFEARFEEKCRARHLSKHVLVAEIPSILHVCHDSQASALKAFYSIIPLAHCIA